MYKLLSRPGFFVVIGVLMSVLSAVISNYFMVQNEAEIEKSRMQLLRLQNKIDHVWQESLLLEQIEEVGTTILLLYHASSAEDERQAGRLALQRYLEKVIRTGAVDPATAKNIRALVESDRQPMNVLSTLFGIIDNHKANAISQINDLYVEQATLERSQHYVEERNMVLRNVALFLHIMGVMLMLFGGMGSGRW